MRLPKEAKRAGQLDRKAVETCGRLDCVFNDTGIEGTVFVPTADYTIEAWDQLIGVIPTGV
jgi:NAD(P)-dependent dehydrogenase (short-subunit alcohol dehydrogenase family)